MNYDVAVSTNCLSQWVSSLLACLKREQRNKMKISKTPHFVNVYAKIDTSYKTYKYSLNTCLMYVRRAVCDRCVGLHTSLTRSSISQYCSFWALSDYTFLAVSIHDQFWEHEIFRMSAGFLRWESSIYTGQQNTNTAWRKKLDLLVPFWAAHDPTRLRPTCRYP